MLEVDEASMAKENDKRNGQIDSMIEESKIEDPVSLQQPHTAINNSYNFFVSGGLETKLG